MLPEGRRLPEVPQGLRPDRGRHPPARQARPARRTRSATRSPRARTRSPTPRSPTYYNKNKARFAQPERRDLRVVLTKDQGQGRRRPRRRSRAASRWTTVAKKYSIDEASKAQGGKLPGAAKGQQEKALDDARLQRQEGRARRPGQDPVRLLRLRGRRRSRRPASRRSTQAKATIKQTLASQNQQKALDTFVKDFRKRWKDKTDCRDGYKTQDCKNAPKADADADGRGAAGAQPVQPTATATPEQLSDRRRTSAAAVARLDELTRRLRRECPWDREQDERSIVPHTVEEAYELAAAAHAGDDAKLLDELGDVLFQVHFLVAAARGARRRRRWPTVAEHCRQKLIRRHPHVFGEVEVEDAGEVLRNWDAIKATRPGREPGIFGEVPENLPGPLYARKVQRRAASTGFDFEHVPYDAVERRARGAARGRARPRGSASTRSATCCSRPSTSRAS